MSPIGISQCLRSDEETLFSRRIYCPTVSLHNRDSCLNTCRDHKDGFIKTWNSAIHLRLRAFMSPHWAMHEMKMASWERVMRNYVRQCTPAWIPALFFIPTTAARTKNCRINCLRCGWGSELCESALGDPVRPLEKPTELYTTIIVRALVAFIWVDTETVTGTMNNTEVLHKAESCPCVGGTPSQPQLPAFRHFLPRFTSIAQRY